MCFLVLYLQQHVFFVQNQLSCFSEWLVYYPYSQIASHSKSKKVLPIALQRNNMNQQKNKPFLLESPRGNLDRHVVMWKLYQFAWFYI